MNAHTYTLQPAYPHDYYDAPWQGYYWGDKEFDNEFVLTHIVPHDSDSIKTAYKWLSRIAWQVRRIEAKRFGVPVMKVSWLRCLLLAAIINDRRRGQNSWLVAGIKQRAWLGRGALVWC